ncbi:ImmA/IrrE family metallo-endopeptidase [Thermaerobacter marianensis]|nr:ImmA/IrrE family metallo-endopeptidase [Thermaerobacter marianensis]
MAATEGILVEYVPLLPSKGLLGLYLRTPHGAAIVLDSSLPANPRLERCVMAEELGHHFTVPVTSTFVACTSATARTSYRRDEARALRWACDHLMPLDQFLQAMREGVSTVEELADYFYVTPWMVHARFRFLPSHLCRCLLLCRELTCLGCPEAA